MICTRDLEKEVKIAEDKENKDKIIDRTNYGVLGIVAIVAVVGIVLLFSEKLELGKGSISSDNSGDITGSFLHTAGKDCVSSPTRPCYDKQTGKKIVGLEPKGGEKAFDACLKNAAPNEYGALTIKTSKCDAEQLNYCYDGRSKTMLRKFEGQCTALIPSPKIDCPSIPFIEFVSGVEEDWDSSTINLGLRTIFSSKSGALYIGGFQYVATGTIPSYKYVAKVYKSVDSGKNWAGVALPDQSDYYFHGFVRRIIEDSTGTLYAAGSWLWKSTDGGNTWSMLQSITDMSTGGSVQDVLQSKDGSLIALVYKTQPTYSNEVYKSYDGGKTWQLIIGPVFQNNPSYNFVEANDGSLIFSSNNGDIYHLALSGALTKTQVINIYAGNIHFLKAHDGAIYFIAENPEKLNEQLTSYQSTDNGRTWTKTGELPYSSLFAWDAPIEGYDGSIWVAANTICWESTIYKSSDKGVSWNPVATAPLNLFVEYDRVSFVGPKIIDIAENGGKIYSVPYGFGAVFSTP